MDFKELTHIARLKNDMESQNAIRMSQNKLIVLQLQRNNLTARAELYNL